MRSLLFIIVCFTGLAATPAHSANPELLAHVQGIQDPEHQSSALRLGALTLDVDVVGALAETTLTARFENSSGNVLEGDFTMELPEGAVVTGYALDVNGQLLDGVLIEPLKAERTYEARVRRGIDPGVAKVSRANVFSTRVFPIPGMGGRTIRLKFAAPIHTRRGLAFPLTTQSPVGELAINVRSFAVFKAPQLTLPNKMTYAWRKNAEGLGTKVKLGAAALTGELRIAPVQPLQPALVSRHASGARRVHIVDTTARTVARAATGGRLRVYWDRSRSRREQNLAGERALLGKYLAQTRPSTIDLVVFNSTGANVKRVSSTQLDGTLKSLAYRGATSYAVLEKLRAPQADVCLMFTDGVATIDQRHEFDPGCEVFAITSAADADRGFLQRLAGGAASAVLQLSTQKDTEILARLAGGGPSVVQARSEDGRPLRFATLDGGENGWSVITEEPVSGGVILRIAGIGNGLVERTYAPMVARKSGFDGTGALWAAIRVGLLAAEDGAHAEFVALSRQFSVASPGLAFLVLETPQDYIEADIAPPESYPKELLAQYRELKTWHDNERRAQEEQRLEVVAARWKNVVDWWSTEFDAKAGKEKKIAQRGPAPLLARRADSAPAPAVSAARVQNNDDVAVAEEVVVSGIRRSLQAAMEAKRDAVGAIASNIEIEMKDWDVARPYIKALDSASRQDLERVLAAQEREFGDLPVFYFDVAEWFHRHQRTPEATELLLSALDLAMANEETEAMVAERLQRYGGMDRAIWLLERAAERTDYLPQPKRSLALALAKRATAQGMHAREDLERAVQLLNEVIMTPWTGQYDGIEVISLMEANQLLPALEALGMRQPPLDARLRALLDVDLRVVIEWNTAATDMDLWVDEPNGERAYYSNPRTAIGGHLSNDMTQGFGPEEYLLKRAAKGEYKISVNVYATDRINPNGSTVVTAHLFRDFGRAGQREQAMEIELVRDASGEKLIGSFKVL